MPKYLCGLEGSVTFKDGTINFKTGPDRIFYGDSGKLKVSAPIECEDKDMYRLGWDSCAVFQCDDDGFKLEKLTIFGPENQGVDKTVYKHYAQIFTNSVDTCTFLFLKKGDKCLMAHIDQSKLEKAKAEIAAFAEANGKENVRGVISFVDDNVEENEEEYEKRDEERKFYNYIKDLFPAANSNELVIIARGEVSTRKSHVEIGACKSEGRVMVYGDLTDRCVLGNSLPSERFELEI